MVRVYGVRYELCLLFPEAIAVLEEHVHTPLFLTIKTSPTNCTSIHTGDWVRRLLSLFFITTSTLDISTIRT